VLPHCTVQTRQYDNYYNSLYKTQSTNPNHLCIFVTNTLEKFQYTSDTPTLPPQKVTLVKKKGPIRPKKSTAYNRTDSSPFALALPLHPAVVKEIIKPTTTTTQTNHNPQTTTTTTPHRRKITPKNHKLRNDNHLTKSTTPQRSRMPTYPIAATNLTSPDPVQPPSAFADAPPAASLQQLPGPSPTATTTTNHNPKQTGEGKTNTLFTTTERLKKRES
jgi:hypothetical protein